MNSNRRPTVGLILLCIICQSCSSDSEKFVKEIQAAVSWVASARMVGEAYANGNIPTGYARKALASFDRQLQSSAQRLQSISDDRRELALANLKQAEQTVAEMQTTLDNPSAFAQLNVHLASQQQSLVAATKPKAELPQP